MIEGKRYSPEKHIHLLISILNTLSVILPLSNLRNVMYSFLIGSIPVHLEGFKLVYFCPLYQRLSWSLIMCICKLNFLHSSINNMCEKSHLHNIFFCEIQFVLHLLLSQNLHTLNLKKINSYFELGNEKV